MYKEETFMQYLARFASNVFYLLGERIALLALLILAVVLLLTQKPLPAFSETRPPENYEVSSNNLLNEEASYTPDEVEEKIIPALIPTSTPPPAGGPTATPTILPASTPAPTIIVEPTLMPTIEPTASPVPVVAVNPADEAIWESLAKCESGGNWAIDTGNGYYGGLQFSQSAWESVGGAGNPAAATREEQISRGKDLQARRGWGVWGLCAKKLGLS